MAILSVMGCSKPTQGACVDSNNQYITCPAERAKTPEEQTKSKYVTTIEGCKIFYITTPNGFSNVYLSKCDNGDSSIQSKRTEGKSTKIISNSTSYLPDNQTDTPSLNNLVDAEQQRKNAISKLTLEERQLLLDSASAVNGGK